jgi:hypothetical protein
MGLASTSVPHAAVATSARTCCVFGLPKSKAGFHSLSARTSVATQVTQHDSLAPCLPLTKTCQLFMQFLSNDERQYPVTHDEVKSTLETTSTINVCLSSVRQMTLFKC